MKTFTTYAEKKAKQFFNLLQRYTKSIRITAMLMLLVVGISNAWAYNFYSPHIYFNNADLNWNPAMLFVGHDSYSQGYNQTKNPIDNTKLVYFHPTASWSDQKYFTIGNSQNWGAESNGFYNRVNYLTHIGIQSNYNFNSNNTYYVTGSVSSSISVSYKSNDTNEGYKSIPTYDAKQAAKVRDINSGTYTNISGTFPATLKIKGTYLSGWQASTRSEISGTKSTDSNKYVTVVTGLVTHSYSNLSDDYQFDGWGTSTTPSSTNSTYEYNISATTTVYAFFTKKYAVTFGTSGNGSITATADGNNITSGTKVVGGSKIVFTATPATGYQIEGWYSDAACTSSLSNGTNTTYTISSLTAATTVYVKFKANTYTVTLDQQNGTGGTGSVIATYNSAMPSITAPTRTGYTFGGYYTATNGGGTQYYKADGTSAKNWDKTSATTLYAKWTENTYTVTINNDGHGTTSPSGEQTVGQVTSTTITATPSTGYQFLSWTYSGGVVKVSESNTTEQGSITITATATGTVTANFEPIPETKYDVEIIAGANGSVSPSGIQQVGESGIDIEATANDNYQFSQWTTTGGATVADANSASTAVTATAAGTVTANFTEIMRTITVTCNTNHGTVSPSSTTAGVVTPSGNIAATPKTGYEFVNWTATTGITIANANSATTTITKATANGTVTANFQEKKHNVTVSYKYGDTTIKDNTTTSNVGEVTSTNITAPTIAGYTFSSWTLGTGITNKSANTTTNPISITTNSSGNYTLTANYEEDLSSTYYVEGDDAGPFTEGWNANENTMMKKRSGESTSKDVYWELEVPAGKVTPNDNQWEFKIYNSAGTSDKTKWLGWGTDNNYYWLTKENNNLALSTSGSNNIRFKPYLVGTYTFHVNYDNPSSPTLEVIWPTLNQICFYSAQTGGSGTDTYEWENTSSTTWTKTISLSKGTHYFKVLENSEYFGNTGTMTRGNCSGWTMSSTTENCGITADVAGDYLFSYNTSTNKLTVTYPEAYTVTYSHVPTAAADAPTTNPSITSGDYVLANTGVTFTAKDANNGYTWKGWYNNEAGDGDALSTNKAYTKSITATTSIYAVYTENTTNVTIDANDRNLGTLKVSGAAQGWGYSTSVGVATTKSITATPKDNSYEFTGWTLIDNVTTSDDTKKTTITIKGNGNGGSGTVTANFRKIVRTITFDQEGGAGGTETLTAIYGETATKITTPTKTGYIFGGYWTEDNGTGTQIVNTDGTWIANKANFTDANNKWIVTSDKTLYAKWEENLSTITIKTLPTGAGALKVGGSNFTAGNTTTVGITTSRTVVASNTDGFTFKEWQKSDNITITSGSLTSPSITIKGNGNGGAGTLTAVYDEDLSTPYVFKGGTAFGGDNWATEYPLTKRPGESNVQIGYVTFNITGINSNGGNEAYQFKIKKGDTWYGIPADGNWWYTREHSTEARSLNSNTGNIGLITDMVGAYTIKVDYTNESDPRLTVSYPSTEFYLLGFGNDNSYWAEDESKKFSVDAGIATITKTLTAGTHEFKIEEKVNDDEIWRTSSIPITRANNTNIDFSNTSSDAANAKITADVAGTYTFTYDVVNQKLTVIYPSKLTLTDGPTTSVSSATTSNPLTTVPGQTITATPTITSTGTKAFCWGLYTDAECTDGNKVDNITFTSLGAGKVSFALPEVEKTYYLKLTIHPDADCKQDPEETIIAPINATTEKFIFFKKNISASKWNNVYVNFYNEKYWDSQGKGSGNSNNMISANNKMTQIKGTNIFYFNYSGITPKNVVSFVNKSGDYDNFHMCQVVYREDMKLDCAPMFVSRDYIQSHNYINSSEYYDGYWTTFAPDVDAKHKIQINEGEGYAPYDLTSTTPTRTYTLSRELSANTTVHFYLQNACYTTDGYGYYGVYGEMDVKNCTNWVMYHSNNNIALKTRSAGEYTFIVSFLDNGEIRVSVEYPLMEGDYQLIYKDSDNRPHPSDYVRNRANGEDIVSLYINKEKSPTVTLQQWDGNKWNVKKGANNQPITVDLSPIIDDGTMTSGVYNFKITQPAEGDITSNEAIVVQGRYLGYYYIRTNSAEGKWKTYKMDSHKMTYSAYADENEGFTHYFCEFLGDNKSGSEDFIGTHDDDISFAIACDYAKALTDTLEGDTYTNGLNLYESASVRFMYNTHTNGLRRAYLKGRHESTDYLKLTKGEGNMTLNEGGEPINEITFEDEGNWIYSIDVYVTPVQINDAYTFSGTLTAKYPINTVLSLNTQYFYATPGQDTNSDGIPDSYSHKQIIGGSDGAQLKVAIRYDFKTNRLMRAWKPTDEITDDLPISADILLIRKGQDAATQINLSSGTEITDVQTIYGAIQFDYNDVVGKVTSWNSHAYEFGRYYVSFPFDVAVSDIFGFGTLNENWQIQRYNGQKRADIGWFAETSTFWEPMQETEVMNANEGYILALDRMTLNGDNNVMWQNKEAGSSVYLYFPSSSATKTIANGTQTIHVPKHQCNIDREFQVENGTKTVNHQNTDSHWNVIGSPLFENKVATQIAEGPETEHPDDVYPAETKLRYFYKWQYEEGKENTYAVSAAFNTDHAFLTMHGYMVQYAGDVTFEGASITPPASVAARRVAENEQNYTVELQLYNEDIEASRTYVELRENAIDSFLLSEDLYMIRSSHFADVFTYAGAYDVAANVLSINSHIVPVGVQVKKAGTYTFSMTTPFDGTVTLIDYHTGSRTNLGWSDYTLTLEKGTINDRFALEINIQHVSTDVEGNTGNFKGKDAVKFLHNGILYIKKGDAIYDARGSRVSMSYEL